jgi:hypothetical protein
MATLKRLLVAILVGAGVGMLITMFVAPNFIVWWDTPTVPTLVSCTEQERSAVTRLREAQLIAGAVCSVLAMVVAQIFHARRGKANPIPASPVPASKP